MAALNKKKEKRYGRDALSAVVQALRQMRHQQPDGRYCLRGQGAALDVHDVDSLGARTNVASGSVGEVLVAGIPVGGT